MTTLSFPKSSSNKTRTRAEEGDIYFSIGYSGCIVLSIIFYLISIAVNTCSERGVEYLRIDIIYSKNFDRLFIGLVKNDETAYIKKVFI